MENLGGGVAFLCWYVSCELVFVLLAYRTTWCADGWCSHWTSCELCFDVLIVECMLVWSYIGAMCEFICVDSYVYASVCYCDENLWNRWIIIYFVILLQGLEQKQIKTEILWALFAVCFFLGHTTKTARLRPFGHFADALRSNSHGKHSLSCGPGMTHGKEGISAVWPRQDTRQRRHVCSVTQARHTAKTARLPCGT
jgi:hypothetical protein